MSRSLHFVTGHGATGFAFSVFLPSMSAELGWPRSQLVLATSMAWITASFVGPWFGKLIDRHGARVIVAIGMVVLTVAVAGSGLAGVIVGCLLPQDRFWSRSRQPTLRVIQDLLAYDFYTPVIYRATIVRLVAGLAQATRWFDLNVVKGAVDGVGRLSLATAEGLKLSVSGQLQTYVLTLVVSILLLLGGLQWLRLGF